MTLDRTAARARCEAATPEPWLAADSNEGCWPAPPQWEVQSDTWANPHHYPDDELLPEMCLQIEWYGGNTKADANFIAHARTDLPLALDELDAKDAEIERLREVWDELVAIKDNYGDECDHMLTRDAIDLKRAINRIWEELERMCPGALATLEGRD